MPEVRRVVNELLTHMGSSREARWYLKEFSDAGEARFAVVKVGGGILRDHHPALTSALAFLHRLGLIPVVLHGAGPQLDQALQDAGLATEHRDGLRISSEAVMAQVRPVMYAENLRLVDALEDRGVKARGIANGVFRARFLDRDQLGFVGEVESVDLSAVRSAVHGGAIPILTCLGETAGGQVLNINADVATRALVRVLRPYKVIFLTPTGGLLDGDGQLISAINLNSDYARLMQQDWVHSGMRLKLQQIHAMLQEMPDTASVSITSAARLTRELFTYRGAGTLIRKGEDFRVYEPPGGDTLQVAKTLIETAFDQSLRDGWFADLEQPVLLLSESHRAAAIIARGVEGPAYLDKFIVTPEARGEGMGSAIWQRIRERFPALYWRAHNANPITPWYFQQADCSERHGQWVVFTVGVQDRSQRERCIRDALSRDSGWSGQ